MANNDKRNESWLVLGASSSVARAFARAAAEDGADVILAGRDMEDMARIAQDVSIRTGREADVIAFDAENLASHAAFVADVVNRAVFLNVFLAFGAMPEQEEIDDDFALAERTIAVNYTGALSVLHRLAPHLEEQGGGHVVVLSSVAGDRGRLKNYIYGSTKAGLNAYLQGLSARLFRKGVSVTTIKPGFMDTDMTWGVEGMFLVASPDQAARACLSAARKRRQPPLEPTRMPCCSTNPRYSARAVSYASRSVALISTSTVSVSYSARISPARDLIPSRNTGGPTSSSRTS